MPGVHAVLTHEDVPGAKTYGLEFTDQPVLAIDRVRYTASRSRSSPPSIRSRHAVRPSAIRVEYEELAPVADMERALESTDLHPEKPTRGHGYLDDDRPNVVRHMVIRHGDPDAQGDVSVSGYYEVGIQDQAFLGPESGLAVPDGEGGVDIYVATQWLHVDRVAGRAVPRSAARAGAHPPRRRRRRVRRPRGSVDADARCAARAAHEPAGEDRLQPRGVVHRPRAPSSRAHVVRAPRDARRQARQRPLQDPARRRRVRVVARPRSRSNAASFAVGPYESPNALIDSTSVYTNNPPCGAMRGFGAVQTCFAGEAQMDKLAAALGIDPVELRLLNALEPGDILPTGQAITGSMPVAEVHPCAPRRSSRPSRSRCRATRSGSRAARATRRAATACAAASASRSASRTSATRRASTTTAPPACGSSPTAGAEVHCAAAEVGQGVDGVILQVARTELGLDDVRLAPRPDGDRRVRGLGVGVAHDLDGGGRRARRVPAPRSRSGARGRVRRSTSSGSTAIRARRRSTPRPGRSPASGRTSRSRPAR